MVVSQAILIGGMNMAIESLGLFFAIALCSAILAWIAVQEGW